MDGAVVLVAWTPREILQLGGISLGLCIASLKSSEEFSLIEVSCE